MKPVSRTAFYCCGVRGLDARSTRPVCGDLFAERFMDEEAWRTFEFRRFHGPNASNVMRHRILDDLLRERVARDPRRRIVLLGAGLDSRAFRLTGGRWLEVDEAQVFAWKEPRLPARDSPNEIVRLGVDFETERLADRLAPFAGGEPVTVVLEGMLMYLEEPQVRELLRTLRGLFPRGEALCDLMSREFFERFARYVHEEIRGLGASFRVPETHLAETLRAEGYRPVARESIVARAARERAAPWSVRILARLSRGFREGYENWTFSPE